MERHQLYFEDVETGDALPSLLKRPTPRQLVMWAGASEEFYEIHYDKDFAASKGLPGIVVHGMLVASFLGQMLTDWIGDEGTLKKLSVTHRAMVFPNQDVSCKGRVTGKQIVGDEGLVECEIWAETADQEKRVSGFARVALPVRAGTLGMGGEAASPWKISER